jgi:hypothetical protein
MERFDDDVVLQWLIGTVEGRLFVAETRALYPSRGFNEVKVARYVMPSGVLWKAVVLGPDPRRLPEQGDGQPPHIVWIEPFSTGQSGLSTEVEVLHSGGIDGPVEKVIRSIWSAVQADFATARTIVEGGLHRQGPLIIGPSFWITAEATLSADGAYRIDHDSGDTSVRGRPRPTWIAEPDWPAAQAAAHVLIESSTNRDAVSLARHLPWQAYDTSSRGLE